jgi:GT2 family glycosyltransferase
MATEQEQKQFAAKSLKEAKQALESLGVKYWLTLGTALGAYRDKDFCVNDWDDIDIGVTIEQYDMIAEITEAMEKAGFENAHNFIAKDGISPEHCFKKPNDLGFRNKIDLWFYTPDATGQNRIFRFYRALDAKIHNTKTNPARHFDELGEIEFYGEKYPIPGDIENYFICNYGPDWRTPISRPAWNYYTDNQSPGQNTIEQEITFIIKTFKRPDCLKDLVQSIKPVYPNVRILICNDDTERIEIEGAEVINTEYDIGLAAGRNRLVAMVETPYFLLMDDDFIFTTQTYIEKLLEKAKAEDLDVSAGALKNKEEGIVHYEGRFDYRDGMLTQIPASEPPYDYVFNFFVGKTDTFKIHKWDERQKLAEHTAFFFNHWGKLKIGYTPEVIVDHTQTRHAEYNAFRARGSEYVHQFLQNYEIKELRNHNGVIYKARPKPAIAPARKKIKHAKNIDICITAFKRPEALDLLLFSIAKYYPQGNIYVADQGGDFNPAYYKKLRDRLAKAGLQNRPSFEKLPYDCGLSYARNYLVKTTPRKYKLILDDDMEFTPETDIEGMAELMEDYPGYGVVGGLVRQMGSDIHFEFNLQIKNGTIYQIPDRQPMRTNGTMRYKKTGCVLNFALFKKDVFSYIAWDENLKTCEHMDFYLRFRNTLYRIMYTPDSAIEHRPARRNEEYKQLRQRPEFLIAMLKKHNATRVKYLNGQVHEIYGDGIRRYKELPE